MSTQLRKVKAKLLWCFQKTKWIHDSDCGSGLTLTSVRGVVCVKNQVLTPWLPPRKSDLKRKTGCVFFLYSAIDVRLVWVRPSSLRLQLASHHSFLSGKDMTNRRMDIEMSSCHDFIVTMKWTPFIDISNVWGFFLPLIVRKRISYLSGFCFVMSECQCQYLHIGFVLCFEFWLWFLDDFF